MASSTGPGLCSVLLASMRIFHPRWVLHAFLWLFHSPGIIWDYGTKIILVKAVLSLTVSSIRNHIFNRALNQEGHGYVGCFWPPSYFSIQEASSLSHPRRVKLVNDHVWRHWYPSDYSINQEKSLSPSSHPLNTARITLGVIGLPLNIPSTRNLYFLLHGVSNKVRMILCGADCFLNFPSPRNHLF